MKRAVYVMLAMVSAGACAQPTVKNGGFEADRYTQSPGYARQNGKRITAWTIKGNVGVNPVHLGKEGKGTASPFADNSRTPQGRHVLFMQNEATVSQKITGFEKEKRYRVTFRENGRAYNRSSTFAKLTMTLGGKTIVSPHLVKPVCKGRQRDLPYARAVSDIFAAAADGEYELVFQTLNGGGVSVLIDDVRIHEIGPGDK